MTTVAQSTSRPDARPKCVCGRRLALIAFRNGRVVNDGYVAVTARCPETNPHTGRQCRRPWAAVVSRGTIEYRDAETFEELEALIDREYGPQGEAS